MRHVLLVIVLAMAQLAGGCRRETGAEAKARSKARSAAKAESSVLEKLAGQDEAERWQAVVALTRDGRPSGRARGQLERMTRSANRRARCAATVVLAKIKPADTNRLAGLIEALDDPHRAMRVAAAEAIVAFGPAVEGATTALIGAVGSDDTKVRVLATEALVKIQPPTEQIVGVLADCLNDEFRPVRLHAIRALVAMDIAAPGVIPALRRAVASGSRELRQAALEALMAADLTTEGVVDAIAAVMSVDDPKLQADVMDKLLVADPAIPGVTAVWSMGLDSLDRKTRVRVMRGLRTAPPLPDVIDCIMKAARDEDRMISAMGLVRIGELGPQAKRAAPLLVEIITGPRTGRHMYAVDVLAHMAHEDSALAPMLCKVLLTEEGDVRTKLVAAVGQGGLRAKELAGVLGDLLNRAETPAQTREAIVAILSRLGPPAAAAARQLRAAAERADQPEALQRAIEDLLATFGAEDEPADSDH